MNSEKSKVLQPCHWRLRAFQEGLADRLELISLLLWGLTGAEAVGHDLQPLEMSTHLDRTPRPCDVPWV